MSESPLLEPAPVHPSRERRANLAFLALVVLAAIGAALLNDLREGPPAPAAPKVEARNAAP